MVEAVLRYSNFEVNILSQLEGAKTEFLHNLGISEHIEFDNEAKWIHGMVLSKEKGDLGHLARG